MLASPLYITKMVLTTYFHGKRMEQERIGTRALFFKFSGHWIIFFFFFFGATTTACSLYGLASTSAAFIVSLVPWVSSFLLISSFTWHVHYWQLCSWLSMVEREKKKIKAKGQSKKG